MKASIPNRIVPLCAKVQPPLLTRPPSSLSLSPLSLPLSWGHGHGHRHRHGHSLPPWPRRIACTSSLTPPPSQEELKSQLESLQAEEDQARAKATSARARFMRLMEAVESLRKRAAMDLRMGNEKSARKLLTEKKKVMEALEFSKQRAELFEELSRKLNQETGTHTSDLGTVVPTLKRPTKPITWRQDKHGISSSRRSPWVISRKETELIATLSSGMPRMEEMPSNEVTVRVVSPREMEEGTHFSCDRTSEDGKVNPNCSENSLLQVDSVEDSLSEADAYESFLREVDFELSGTEEKLHNFLKVAHMVLSQPVEIGRNARVATVKQILHDIQHLRLRICDTIHHQQGASDIST